MNIIPWRKHETDPFRSDFDDLWRGFFEPFQLATRPHLPELLQHRAFPPVNVSESENHLTVSIELPGLEAKDVSIELMGNQLQISGERKWEEEKRGKEFHRVESQYGSFSRTLTLPQYLRLERESIEATFQKGILEIRIPKLEPTPTAKIPIRAK